LCCTTITEKSGWTASTTSSRRRGMWSDL
jgi:hypothetical protein